MEKGTSFKTNGYNYRLSEISAALGIAQMNRINEILSDRRSTAIKYLERLAEFDNVLVPLSAPSDQCTFQSFVILLGKGSDRNTVIRKMRDQDIETTLGTYALHAHPAFYRFGYQPGDLQNSWENQEYSLTLPLLPKMDDEMIDRITLTLKNVIEV